jgi:type IV secretory pathway VirB2 component (pilin)
MGGTVSTSTAKTINDLCTNTLTSTIMKCITSTDQNQLLQFSNIKGDLTIDSSNLSQTGTFDVSCILSASNTQTMSNDIANTIAQYAESNGQAALSALGNTKASVINDISNKVYNSISNLSSTDVKNMLAQNQKFIVDGITGNVVLKNVKLDQQATIISKTLLTSTAVTNIINDTATKIDQSTKSTEKNPISDVIESIGTSIGSLFGSPGFTIAVIICLLIGAVVLYYYFDFRKTAVNVAASSVSNINISPINKKP